MTPLIGMNLKQSFKVLNVEVTRRTDNYLRALKTKEEVEEMTRFEIMDRIQGLRLWKYKKLKSIKNADKHIERLNKLFEIYDDKVIKSMRKLELKNIDIDKEIEKLDALRKSKKQVRLML